MSADITVEVGDRKYWSIGAYSVTEQSTPIDPSDTTGGIGQLTVPVPKEAETRTYIGKDLDLRDSERGTSTGTVRNLNGAGAATTIVADSRLSEIAVTRTAQPYSGYLDGLIRYYLSLCGVTDGIDIDPSIRLIPVAVPGWNANVYDRIKALGPAFNVELSLVGTTITVRPTRTRVTVDHRSTDPNWVIDSGQLARTVEGYYYTSRWATDLAYPGVDGWNEDVQVYQVNAGETTEVTVELSASLQSVEQPQPVDSVSRTERKSVYAVSGNDALPVKAAQWTNGGGRIEVEIGEDTRSLKIKIIGPTGREAEQYSPYSIAMSAGPSDTYSSLRIRGTGVFFNKTLDTIPATIDEHRAPEVLGATVDNEAFASSDQLFKALLWAAVRYTHPRQTIALESRSIAVTDWQGDASATQQFGNVAGSRILHEGCWYRVRNATLSPARINYDGEWDTTMGDAFPGNETWTQWQARWAGKTWADFVVAPTTGLDSDGFPAHNNLYPATALYPSAGLYPA